MENKGGTARSPGRGKEPVDDVTSRNSQTDSAERERQWQQVQRDWEAREGAMAATSTGVGAAGAGVGTAAALVGYHVFSGSGVLLANLEKINHVKVSYICALIFI